MDTPLRVLQERTNRLNQQFNENEENINRRFSKGLLQELQETNDSITINTETLIKDLESQLEENTKAQRGKDETIGRLKEDIEILLEMNKSQANEIEGLRVRVNEAEAEASAKREQAELWQQEQQDLRSEKADMREEIVRTMEKLSQQKVHAESMEIEYKKQIVELEEKLMSSVHMSEEKGYLIDELIDKYNELKEDFDAEIELRHDQEDKTEQIRSFYDEKILRLENEIVDLNMQAIEQRKKYEAVEKANAEFSHKIIQGKNEEIDELLHENMTLKVKDAEKFNQIQALEKESADVRTAKLEFETETSNRHMGYFKQLESKIEELNEYIVKNNEKFAAESTALRASYEEKLSQLRSSKEAELNELTMSRDQLKSEHNEMRTSVEVLKSQLLEARSHMNEAVDVKEQIIQNLNAELKELNGELVLKNQDNKELTRELNLLNLALKEATSKVIGLNKDCHELDTCYKELSEQNGLLQSEYQSLNEAYEEKCNELCDELEKIRNCKEGYLEEIKRFQDTIGHANEEIESLRDHLERLGEQVKIAEYHGDERVAGLERELSQLVNNELKELEMLRQMIPALEGQFTQELQQMHEQHREQREQLRANMESHTNEMQALKKALAELQVASADSSSDGNLIEFSDKSTNESVSRLGQELKEQVVLSRQLDEGLMNVVEEKCGVCVTSQEYPELRPLFKLMIDELNGLKDLLTSHNRDAFTVLRNVLHVIQIENSDLLNEIHNNFDWDNNNNAETDGSNLFPKLDRASLRAELKTQKLNESHMRRELKHLQYCKDAEEIKTDDLKQMLEAERSKSFELIQQLNDLKRKSPMYLEQCQELTRELNQVRQLLSTETKNFHKSLSKLESDYLHKMSSFQKQESKFSELEARTKSLQELLLKKQINYLNDDLKNEKSRSEHSNAVTSNLVQKLADQNSELALQNKNLLNEVSELHRTVKSLTELNQELKASGQSMLEKRFDLQSTVQDLTNQNLEYKNIVLDRNILKIANNTLVEKNRELQSMVQSLSANNYELKSYINKNQLNKALSDNHKDKFKRLYLKYLRSEAFRKSLVYQKRFLVIILSGYERKEDHQYSRYEYKNQTNRPQFRSFYSKRCIAFKARNHFKAVVFTIVATIRIKNLVRKYQANLLVLDATCHNTNSTRA